MMNQRTSQRGILQTFSQLDDWMDKYEYLIDCGRSLPEMDRSLKTQAHAISGCQSKVWMAAEVRDGQMHFQADSDALITRGLIALVFDVLNGQRPETIVQADVGFLQQAGLTSNLSPSRANGLVSIVNHMKYLAAQSTVGRRKNCGSS